MSDIIIIIMRLKNSQELNIFNYFFKILPLVYERNSLISLNHFFNSSIYKTTIWVLKFLIFMSENIDKLENISFLFKIMIFKNSKRDDK